MALFGHSNEKAIRYMVTYNDLVATARTFRDLRDRFQEDSGKIEEQRMGEITERVITERLKTIALDLSIKQRVYEERVSRRIRETIERRTDFQDVKETIRSAQAYLEQPQSYKKPVH